MKKVLGPKWKEDVIECRPSDLLKPMWDKCKSEIKEHDDIKINDENVMIYALYPQVGLRFLQKKAKAEFISEELPLPINHDLTRAMVKQSFPEYEKIWLEKDPPEKRSGSAQIH